MNALKEKTNVSRISKFSNNLLSFSKEEKISILRSKMNVIVRTKLELKKYVIEALENNKSCKNIYLGVLSQETINSIISKVTDISGANKINLFDLKKEYQLVINQEEIRHLNKESLSEKDIINFINSIDDLIVNFDTVRYTVYNNNQKGLRFKKKMYDGTHIALEIISKQKGTIRTHTLFLDKIDFIAKKRSTSPTFDE